MVSRESIVRATNNQVSADLSGALVILQLKDGVYFQLNEVGAHVWKQISAAPRRVTDLIQSVVTEYDVEQSRCEADVLALMEDLLKRGLIEV
jgi:sulfur transfer complex TusBCD TusB component (DsrH family)